VLVGDSAADARACSAAVVVGVATGRTSAHDLYTAGATRVLPDLRDTRAVVEAVGEALRTARARAHENEEGP
jgi:phosphoglycolate phosphatase-like HAD superfamily hydrolase